jgi:hypothetical protein
MFLSKSFLLLVLNEVRGVSYSKGFESLGFAGSLLMDLYLQGKITLTGSSIEVIESSSTGDKLLDQILKIIESSEKKRTLTNWIDRISQKYEYYYLYFDLMEQEGILKSEINPDLNTKLYYLKEPEFKSQLLDKISKAIKEEKELTIEIICLIVLIEESGLTKLYFPRDIRKKVKTFFKTVLKSNQFDSSSIEMIFQIKKEIINVIGARNMFMMDET